MHQDNPEETDPNIQHYLMLLSDGDASQRWKAAEALGRRREDSAVTPLIEALKDEDWRVREKAAWALGKIGDPRAIRHLRVLMRDEVEIVQE
ncbi:MAG TPA: HEAT repeat domain-containing protein, partial [Methanomicrobiales archaeon]|nr:HEAT repeat domain-containing protein [Methanomicrobiales archaeon]